MTTDRSLAPFLLIFGEPIPAENLSRNDAPAEQKRIQEGEGTKKTAVGHETTDDD